MTDKKCSRCQEHKDVSEFSKNRCKKDGLNQECKVCNRLSHKEAREKGHTRWHDIKKNFGITKEQYTNLLEYQQSSCAICGKQHEDVKGSRLYVDHCHTTNKIRGLLCSHCNLGLGHFRDDTELLHRAQKYLIRSRYER